MRVVLVGVGCVGKTTIGGILAGRLGWRFIDLDGEVEASFGTSIERLQAHFGAEYVYRKQCAGVLKKIMEAHADCVIAGVPSGLRDAYLRVVGRIPCLTVTVEDTAENILERLTFYDIDSKPLKRRLTAKEKGLYLREIREDIAFFRRTYWRADLRARIAGLDAQGAAELIERLIRGHGRGRDSS